ncbi:T9SS type B sorting domain-containing protein [Winogradskyella luteola]|uniref:T9SS type B sorting domain-containing protein n=1 Tax=Winogradskyella luteola TaxID=2828330 RepID=A0A9X1FA45_9FLAO|nr:T9SS type B sorting domain-containing protein [Winogradskyella luteola]MBV7269886.1 T9SS type B sorting domain-containing protein [Winogradskyella luteola]
MLKLRLHIFYLVCIFVGYLGLAQSPPNISATGNQLYCGESPMPIVTDVSISNSSGNNMLDEVFVQIATGYTVGFDILSLSGDHPDISTSWSIGEGLLTLIGPASTDAFEDAIRAIRFQTNASNFTQDKFFSINLGNANFLPVTGHYYIYVADDGITWTQARQEASEQTYFGLQGYLATITTEEEVQLTGEQALGTGWIGGSDQAVEGIWRWETGPEAGQVFWEGLANGSAPDGMFAFWNTGEPNSSGDEDYAHITAPNIGILGSWNDLPDQGNEDPDSDYHPKGYVVEFGGMSGDPNINVSASVAIVMPKTNISKNSLCGEGTAQIDLITNTDDVLWYETSTSTEVINTGLSYESFIDTSTTYYVLPLFSGCTDGNRIPITVDVFELPVANDVTIIQCDDEEVDGISTFNLNNYTDDIIRDELGQVNPNWNITFYEDENLTVPINGGNYINTSNFQVVYVQVFDELTNCLSTSEVTLQVNTSNGIVANLEVCDDFIVDGFVFFDLTEADNQILDSAPVNATIQYYVTYNEALLRINEITEDYFNEVAYNQTVYARVDIDNTCYSINPVNLTVKELPNVTQYEEVYYCLNSFPESITLDGGIINDIPNNYAYDWSTGDTTIHIDVNEIGTYEVFVTRPTGCANRRTIVVKPSSTATIETIEVADISDNNTITVLVSGEGEYVYALNNENGIYQESNTFENVLPGIHTVYVKDIKADCGIVSEVISVLGFPKFFTPNGDMVNDTWQILGFSTQFPVTARVEIFNRYGKIITILTENNQKWDGKYNGKLLPTDDYWFIATLLDGRTIKGHFTLKR